MSVIFSRKGSGCFCPTFEIFEIFSNFKFSKIFRSGVGFFVFFCVFHFLNFFFNVRVCDHDHFYHFLDVFVANFAHFFFFIFRFFHFCNFSSKGIREGLLDFYIF